MTGNSNHVQSQGSFLTHIFSGENKNLLWITGAVSVLYFIILKLIYPLPSFCGDSYTYIATARYDYPVSYRPVLYSKYINFFHQFSKSDVALVAAQYISNVLANLFLYLTCTWLFQFRRHYRYLLFLLLICNPFYLFYSNYITSDPFFNSLTVVWFTLLIWMLHRVTWLLIIIQLVILSQLFLIRYNAIIFPFLMWLVVCMARCSYPKRVLSISASLIFIAAFVYLNTRLTYKKRVRVLLLLLVAGSWRITLCMFCVIKMLTQLIYQIP